MLLRKALVWLVLGRCVASPGTGRKPMCAKSVTLARAHFSAAVQLLALPGYFLGLRVGLPLSSRERWFRPSGKATVGQAGSEDQERERSPRRGPGQALAGRSVL